jgi:beta-alanine--pyruvate transaminase
VHVRQPDDSCWPRDLSTFCFEVPFSSESILFESGKGIRLIDKSGNGYIDGLSGIFVTCFGYDCPTIIQAMIDQLQKLPFNPPLHGTNPPALALADALVGIAPPGMASVKLVSGGSESVEAALRLVRLYHRASGAAGKLKVLSYYHGYHGTTFGSLSLTGRPDTSRFGPAVPGVVHVWPPDCLESLWGVSPADSGAVAAATIERTIEVEGPDSVAAIVVEPVIHMRGIAIAPPGYLGCLRDICDRHNVLLVFDEIVTGFGRTGDYFASQTFGVTPDILCIGKGISGGYVPLAAVLMTERVAAILDSGGRRMSFAPSHTYAANPLASAAGLAAVTLLQEGQFLDIIRNLAARFQSQLEKVVGARGSVRAIGLLYGVKLATDGHSGVHGDKGVLVARACLKRGLIIRGQDDWFVLAPAFVTTEADVEEMLLILGDALDEVCGGGV